MLAGPACDWTKLAFAMMAMIAALAMAVVLALAFRQLWWHFCRPAATRKAIIGMAGKS